MLSQFRCIKCSTTYPLDEIIYRCDKCQALLEVYHSDEFLTSKSSEDWRNLFDSRRGTNKWPYGSGVWSKKEVVLPEIDSENIISMDEGNSNLFWAKRLGEELSVSELWIKQCGVTHTGSFKDLGMTVLVSQVNELIKKGKKIKAVACASTGDTSAALASYAAFAGIPSIVFLPDNKISLAQLIQPVSNGSMVLSLDTDFDGCMEIVQQVTKEKNIYLANSMNSLRIEGQKTISMEIVQQFDWEVPDFIIIPGGNLGNVSALGKGFREMKTMGLIDKYPRIVVAQAESANPLYRARNNLDNFKPISAKKTLASAIQIGDPVSVDKAIAVLKEFDGIVAQASENELAESSARADKTGLFNCPHTAVALASLEKLIANQTIQSHHRVVIISTAHGLKFSQFKVDYHTQQLPFDNQHCNPPIKVKADLGQVLDALNARLN